jgi:hypothetical protein
VDVGAITMGTVVETATVVVVVGELLPPPPPPELPLEPPPELPPPPPEPPPELPPPPPLEPPPPEPPPPPPPELPPPPPLEGGVVVDVDVVDVDDVDEVVDVVDVVEVVDVVVVGVSSSALGAGVSSEYTSRFSEPVPGFVTAFRVADDAIAEATSAGVIVAFCESARAAIPATCGAAIEVPESVRVALSEVCPADTMFDPGANTSRQEPKFENDERSSVEVVDPTVIALGSPAGETVHALTVELPAATTNVTPSSTPRDTARSSAADRGPPRLRFATAGVPA